MNPLLEPIEDEDQLYLLDLLAKTLRESGHWPNWQFVEATLERRGADPVGLGDQPAVCWRPARHLRVLVRGHPDEWFVRFALRARGPHRPYHRWLAPSRSLRPGRPLPFCSETCAVDDIPGETVGLSSYFNVGGYRLVLGPAEITGPVFSGAVAEKNLFTRQWDIGVSIKKQSLGTWAHFEARRFQCFNHSRGDIIPPCAFESVDLTGVILFTFAHFALELQRAIGHRAPLGS